MNKKKVALLILDGWGHGDESKSDGIFNADTPFIDQLENTQPNAELLTHGEHVGLPAGQMGNSEVGHLNIGAGRIVYQELTRINKSIRDGEFQKNPILLWAFEKAKKENKRIHFMGLVSTGGVHSSMDHLLTLCDMAASHGIKSAFIHAFTDGRDCNPKSGLAHLQQVEDHIKDQPVRLASVIGRYYAMDRDNRWERIKKAYDLLIKGIGEKHLSATEAIQNAYDADITDEFILPKVIVENGQPIGNITEGDIVICFNFRTDRCREITIALTQRKFDEYQMQPLNLHYLTMTNYDKSFREIYVIFEKENLKNTLGEVISEAGLSQLRIAETEKYPHVSFFFSGGREKKFKGEHRKMIPSPKVATYDLKPEMSAKEVKASVILSMQQEQPDFICLNFANPDMVGHTGVYDAIIEAAECIDSCVREVVEAGKEQGYSFIIIADHGNSDFVINADGTPNTAHSKNPVPIIVIDEEVKAVQDGILADVAPTILQLMKIKQPEEMNGKSLI
ncbi:MAG: 2,3-bisphosphoglycerate-independent phosphoglycerate mutase [Crocinitomicaceae bacterium]